MNHPLFFKQGKWMPSFALLGSQEIIFHRPIESVGTNSSINRISLNPRYPAQIHLMEKLAQQLYELITNLNLHPQSASSLKMSHLRNMMYQVVKASEQGTESYHNVLYLTLKYLGYLVSREAVHKMNPTQDQVSLESWLADIHSIYFEQQSQIPTSQVQKMLALIKKGEYQQMGEELRCLYCLTDPKDKDKIQRLDLLISILLVKLNSRASVSLMNQQETVKGLSLKAVQGYKEQLSKLVNSTKKTNNNKVLDGYTMIIKLLLGDQSINHKIAEKSWAFFLLNHISFSNPKFENNSFSTLADKFLKKTQNYGRASVQQTDYLFKLLNRESSHHIYQSLLSLVPMIYGHFMGYLLSIIQPSPIPNIYIEDYTLDLMRNLLDHSSQISFKTLVLVFASIDEYSVFGDKLRESFENLLQHHLNVIDESDHNELQNFLSKVKILSQFKYERYSYFQLNLLLNNFLQKGKIDKQTLTLYSYCSMLFSTYYNYEDLLTYYLQDLFVNNPQKLKHLILELKSFKNELQGGRQKKMLKEINQIQPLFERYQLIQ